MQSVEKEKMCIFLNKDLGEVLQMRVKQNLGKYVYIQSIRSSIQIIDFRCSNHFTWPQMYQIKHLGMQTASANICKRMMSKLYVAFRLGQGSCVKELHGMSSLE